MIFTSLKYILHKVKAAVLVTLDGLVNLTTNGTIILTKNVVIPIIKFEAKITKKIIMTEYQITRDTVIFSYQTTCTTLTFALDLYSTIFTTVKPLLIPKETQKLIPFDNIIYHISSKQLPYSKRLIGGEYVSKKNKMDQAYFNIPNDYHYTEPKLPQIPIVELSEETTGSEPENILNKILSPPTKDDEDLTCFGPIIKCTADDEESDEKSNESESDEKTISIKPYQEKSIKWDEDDIVEDMYNNRKEKLKLEEEDEEWETNPIKPIELVKEEECAKPLNVHDTFTLDMIKREKQLDELDLELGEEQRPSISEKSLLSYQDLTVTIYTHTYLHTLLLYVSRLSQYFSRLLKLSRLAPDINKLHEWDTARTYIYHIHIPTLKVLTIECQPFLHNLYNHFHTYMDGRKLTKSERNFYFGKYAMEHVIQQMYTHKEYNYTSENAQALAQFVIYEWLRSASLELPYMDLMNHMNKNDIEQDIDEFFWQPLWYQHPVKALRSYVQNWFINKLHFHVSSVELSIQGNY